MSTRLEDLDVRVMFMAQAGIAVMKQHGIQHVVTSTLRTADEQAALFAQGRKPLDEVNALRAWAKMRPIEEAENKHPVTNCDGVKFKSRHQSGRAIDIVPMSPFGSPEWPPAEDPRWEKIARVMKEQGFRWGGDWVNQDLPHYEVEDVVADFKRAQGIA